MKNRFIKISNLYKIANISIEDINLIDPDFDEEFNNWNQVSPLYDNVEELKRKWSDFSEKSQEVDSNKFSKNFEGFSKWIDQNLPSEMSFLDGVDSLINKIVNFIPGKQNKDKVKESLNTGEVPRHIREVAQTKESQQPFDYNRWKEEISGVESGGNYKATNKHTNALGKYQFVPRIWWDRIKKFATGKARMESYSDFLGNPEMQEAFMKHYTENSLMPYLRKFRSRESTDLPEAAVLSDGRLMALFHFQGPGGAEKWLKTGKMIGAEINASVPTYLKRIT